MARIPLNYGTTAGDGTGDIVFTSFESLESMMVELYGFDTAYRSTAAGNGAGLIGYGDPGGVYAATTVEAALTEIMNEKDQLITDLAATTNGDGAALVGFEDPDSLTAATTVETVLEHVLQAGVGGVGGFETVTAASSQFSIDSLALTLLNFQSDPVKITSAPFFDINTNLDLSKGWPLELMLSSNGPQETIVQDANELTSSGFNLRGLRSLTIGTGDNYSLRLFSGAWMLSRRDYEAIVNTDDVQVQESVGAAFTAGSSTRIAIPAGESLRIQSSVDCKITFGTDANVEVDEYNCMLFREGEEVISVSSTMTHLAVKGVNTGGKVSVSGLERCHAPVHEDSEVIPAGPAPFNVKMPSGNRLRLAATEDCFISFGDTWTDSSEETGMYMEAGVRTVKVPSGTTHVSAQRAAGVDGALHITGVR